LSFSVRRGLRAETLRPVIKRFCDEIGHCVKLVAEIVRGGMSGSPHLSIEDAQSWSQLHDPALRLGTAMTEFVDRPTGS
jgi:hypothetical protein